MDHYRVVEGSTGIFDLGLIHMPLLRRKRGVPIRASLQDARTGALDCGHSGTGRSLFGTM